jgi:spore coat protein JB
MSHDQLELLRELQAMEFTAVDFNLYLDTHPGDQRALMDFAVTVCEVEKLRQSYIQCYGPLLFIDSLQQSCWRWVEEPWPWEIDY